jgi:hypothetical protein
MNEDHRNPDKMSHQECRNEVKALRLVVKRLQEEKKMAYSQGWHACGNAVTKEIKSHGK